MSIKTYNYNDDVRLTQHFKSSEWRCKCGKKHDYKIDSNLPIILEKLMSKVGAVRGDVNSGFRCPKHDKEVGGRGTGSHTQGYACDITFKDKNGKIIPSKNIALALEDLGHKKGIGYRCGGNPNRTHIDVKNRKWYGDEKYSNTKSCCDSFYTYFGEHKPGNKKYIQLKTGVWCRKGIGFNFKKYKIIPKNTVCELLKKNAGKSNGYNWDHILYMNEKVYLPNKWNKYL